MLTGHSLFENINISRRDIEHISDSGYREAFLQDQRENVNDERGRVYSGDLVPAPPAS